MLLEIFEPLLLCTLLFCFVKFLYNYVLELQVACVGVKVADVNIYVPLDELLFDGEVRIDVALLFDLVYRVLPIL